ncbi:V-type proton ATPase 116 kDa subunit a-like isoform X2 [Photinus pyralis]|uniref:V-type proton ATPase subunit a n=1 Tax=Photinus pyralis TaxID=7054 RepID=A0A1Y1N750_PHOPY|nr:V-type proton ATPase 116 kDa subunit a-like isoform X2 [Photinus pyralis]
MGSLFRSEEMSLVQLFIQPEAAYHTISELGEAGVVQFKDLNEDVSSFQRKFVNEVRRCDEMERILRYIETEIKKDKIMIPEPSEIPRAPFPREMIDLEAHLESTEGDIKKLSDNEAKLKTNLLELIELQQVLEKTRGLFNEQDEHRTSMESRSLILDEVNASGVGGQHLSFMAGVINRERVPAFERMIWRVSRGNVFLRQAPIEKPLEDPTGQDVFKTVFVIFFQGEQLQSRMRTICTGFHATLYICPNVRKDREELENNLRTRVEDLNTVINQTNDHRQRVLSTVTKELYNWSVMVKKMKAIYHTLNMFNVDISTRCLIGECWIPVKARQVVQQALNDGCEQSGSTIRSFLNVVPTMETPPTFNNTNKFTKGFQNLIDAYGVASYREVNPALYTIISFPFLFAVMFGDAGHGVIILLSGLIMVLREKKIMAEKISGEIAKIFFGGRYIILLMGLFSIYTGMIYNDVFSRSVNIFGSGWVVTYDNTTMVENKFLQLNPNGSYTGSPYEFGLDPVWQLATNKILFLNSFKMKLSIIFGVVHMIFGVCLSVANHLYFRNYASIFLEFLPQLVFLVLIFLWMVVMMFLKWIMFSASYEPPYSPGCAPSILILFINMMLFKSSEPLDKCKEYMFDGQKELQLAFFVCAIVCVPVMLLGKPIYIKLSKKPTVHKHNGNGSNGDINGIELQTSTAHTHEAPQNGHGHGDDMGEILITQIIHTIEYVLSTISHTASYLRLWALSLAHAQLSEVLWHMVMHMGFTFGLYVGGAVLFFIFGAWAIGTLVILVLMEGLSAFLHTLRLHWVEFMSKFYDGAGYAFTPFCFKRLIDEDEAEEK